MRIRRIVSSLVALSLCGGLSACERESRPVLAGAEEKIVYSIGFNIGEDLKAETPDLDIDLLLRGLQDGLNDAEPLLSDAEVEEVRAAFVAERRAAKAAEQKAEAEKNLKEGERFLRQNAKKEGVVVLASGLQYRVIEPGDGNKPSAEDNVKVHYRGYFIDGTEFENTYAQNQPAVFPVRGVIPGWTEALQLMKEGAKWELFVPSKLAYGEQGAGEIIGPDKTLIFELEFIAIH